MNKNNLKNGFSLVETIVVVAIAAVISGIVLFSISSLRNTNSLKQNVTEARAFIEEARSLSISGKNNLAYGVQLQSDRIIMFAGTTSVQYKKLIFDTNSSTISNISLGGGGSVILFKKLTGGTDNFGSFKIKMNSNQSSSSTINIASTGIISSQ